MSLKRILLISVKGIDLQVKLLGKIVGFCNLSKKYEEQFDVIIAMDYEAIIKR